MRWQLLSIPTAFKSQEKWTGSPSVYKWLSKHSAISVARAWRSRIVESAVGSDFRVWGAKVKSSKIRYEVVRYLSIESKVCLLAGS